MDILERQVGQALRRLLFEQWLRAAGWCCSATMLVVLALVVVDKLWPLGLRLGLSLGTAVGVGLLAAAIWTYARRWRATEAALEIDRRYGLRERISSAYALAAVERESAMGAALVRDAARRVEQIRVSDRFPISFSPWTLLPVVPTVLALLVGFFVGPLGSSTVASAAGESIEVRRQVQASSAELRKKLSEQRERAERDGLMAAEDLFKRLEQQTAELAQSEQVDRKEALVKLNDLAQKLDERRAQLKGSKDLARQFERMKDLQRGPADRMAEALREGNINRAREELQRLREQLETGAMDAEAQRKLAEQAAEMASKLEQMAADHQAAKEDLARRAAEARAAGNDEEADALEEQLEKLKQRDAQMAQAQQMARKLEQCAQKIEQGDAEGAQQAMQQLDGELANLERDLREMAMIEQGLNEVSQSKQSMNCRECVGQGCAHCEPKVEGDGLGKGEGIGKGGRRPPVNHNETQAGRSYDTQVRGQVGQGSGEVIDYVDGPNARGGVQQEIDAQFERARGTTVDPLTEERLPRGYREHAQRYFDALREGRP